MKDLAKFISEYTGSDVYPFHMPGHKRQLTAAFDLYDIDVTEVEPFDDLHHPEGILKDLQDELASYFGAKKSFYLVNGSTCGILSAITAVMDTGEYYLIFDRGSHKSAYNALVLGDIEPEFVFSTDYKHGFYEGVYPQDVDRLLKKGQEKDDDSQKKTLKPCLYVTSPTYDGITADIAALARLIHEQDGILIVDEAHGAHFGMHDIFPESAVTLGADIVIQSLHKTLPSPTQTSVLHICSDRADKFGIQNYLSIFESSSPSYVLMSGISACMGYLEREGRGGFDLFADRLKNFYKKTENLTTLRVIYEEYDLKRRDISKILIGTKGNVLSGHDIYRNLMDGYRLQLEMEAPFYAMAISTLMDTDEGFDRLINALRQMDFEYAGSVHDVEKPDMPALSYGKPKAVISEGRAFRMEKEEVPISEAAGRVSGGFIFLYPPGIPVLAPGELVTEEIRDLILSYRDHGFNIRGLKGDRMEVCSEKSLG